MPGRKKLKKLKEYKGGKYKPKKGRKSIFIYIIILTIILLFTILILLIQLGIIKNPLNNFNIQPKMYNIKDECALIVGQLIHTINDEGICKQKCNNECGAREMRFYDLEFIEKENDCHECNCYCK